MPLNPNYQSIEYQSRTKLLDLAEKAATTSKKDKKAKYLQQAAKIRYFLKATALGTSYLTVDQLNNIYQCLIVTTGIQDFPVAPNLPSVSIPSIGGGPAGVQGTSITSVANIAGDLIVYLSDGTTINAGPLPAGADGNSGYIPFALNGATTGTVDVDTFDYSLSKGVRWDYILDNGTSRRVGSVYTTWLDDGTILSQPLEFHSDAVGTAEADTQVTFDANISGSFITLQATITSGTWSIQGLRYYLPANNQTSGSGTSVLPNGQIFVGNASDEAQARSVSGAITISNTGVTTLSNSVVTNANVVAGAAISVNKLAALTADRITKTDASGFLTVTALTESAISTAIASIAGKQDQITGGATTIVSANLTPTRVLVSDTSGKVVVSDFSVSSLDALETNKRDRGLVTVSSSSYTILVADADKIINLNNVSSRTLTIPLVSTLPVGAIFWIKDSARTSSTAPITINTSGSDLFEDGTSSIVLSGNGSAIGLYTNGTTIFLI